MRLLLLACLLSSPAAAQSTWVVQPGNPAAFQELQSAVAAAADGDVIRMLPATIGFSVFSGILTITKSLRIVGEGTQPNSPLRLWLAGELDLQLAAGKELVLANIDFAPFPAAAMGSVLHIVGSRGRVTLNDIAALPGRLIIDDSHQVLLHRVTSRSRIDIADSTVVATECTLRGRAALFELGLLASPGLRLERSTMQVSHCAVAGGDGAFDSQGHLDSPGQRALVATDSLLVASGLVTFSNGVAAGAVAPVLADDLHLVAPTPPPTIEGTAVFSSLALPNVTSQPLVRGGSATLTASNPVGGPVGLVFGGVGERRSSPGLQGDLWLDPNAICLPTAGLFLASWTVAVPASPALQYTSYRWQAVALVGDQLVLSAPGAAFLR